uniref:Uncharacterized protein n=1 Tax=Oryza nivara TaxID=4536 RepID=A0A0E0GSU7_ORYNI
MAQPHCEVVASRTWLATPPPTPRHWKWVGCELVVLLLNVPPNSSARLPLSMPERDAAPERRGRRGSRKGEGRGHRGRRMGEGSDRHGSRRGERRGRRAALIWIWTTEEKRRGRPMEEKRKGRRRQCRGSSPGE